MTDQELQDINERVAKKLGADKQPGGPCWCKRNYCDHRENYRDYSTSIEAAWEIPGIESIVRLDDGRWYVRFGEGTALNNYYEIDIYEDHKFSMPEAIAPTAPLAICLAFLKLPE